MSNPPSIISLTFNRNASPIGIGQARPPLSWRYAQDASTEANWSQASCEFSFLRSDGERTTYPIDSGENVEVAWPEAEESLRSRERVEVRVRARGGKGKGWTDWFGETVEAALLDRADWSARVVAADVAPPANQAKRPVYFRSAFELGAVDLKSRTVRVHASALGVYELSINGKRVGDHVLAPGWQSYNHRLHYQTYEVPTGVLKTGENTIEAVVGEGWYSGRLTWDEALRNIWGDEIGVMAQLEIGGKVVAATNTEWEWSYGPLLSSELYDGETYDASLEQQRQWRKTKTISLPAKTTLIAPEAPPIRRTEEVKPTELIVTPSGKMILDFGQNLVGWVRIKTLPRKAKGTDRVVLRYAEVLDKGELGMRPLRSAKVTDHVYLDTAAEVRDWEPRFTTHGFRYCEITGPEGIMDEYKENYTAIVVHSDMKRLGGFECSHPLVNKLHENVVWGLRGNFVGVPTDCPQRDERLGWTGDLQAFAPTASFLYDTSGFLGDWLHDLSEEQMKDLNGIVPLVVPNTLLGNSPFPEAQAVWGDVCVLTPKALHEAYGSKGLLREMWQSISTWLHKGIPRRENGLWLSPRGGFQLADWLDPKAPANDSGACLTDPYLVADAYLVGVIHTALEVAKVLGLEAEAKRYKEEHDRVRKAFQHEYLSSAGRLASDTQTAYCLAYQFGLLDEQHLPGAAERLYRLAAKDKFRIATGFAGTPGILHALTQAGHVQVAYRMLEEKGCPSWLYPVTMGATTIWERWDSLLPDGSINPGEMTSFNHYALGAVANFLHTTVAGLKPLSPGYRQILIHPRPGGTITEASAHTLTPSGRAAVSWTLEDGKLKVEAEVPPNTSAILRLGRKDEVVGSGFHVREVKYAAPGSWPPSLDGDSSRLSSDDQ